MNGGGAKKKKTRRAPESDRPQEAAGALGGAPRDGISVDETNRLRESLGLKPLRE